MFFFFLPLALKVMSMSDVLFGHVTGRNNRNRTVGRFVSLFKGVGAVKCSFRTTSSFSGCSMTN